MSTPSIADLERAVEEAREKIYEEMEPLRPGERLRDNECCSDECLEEYAISRLLQDDDTETLYEEDV